MDDERDEFETQPVHKRTSVKDAGVTKPAGAKSSVFDVPGAGTALSKTRKRGAVDVPDLAKVVVRYDVPIPTTKANGRPDSVYRAILKGMKKGGMVVLKPQQACSLVSRARKEKVKVLKRDLGDGTCGVWRM